jgi:hypothetical protein
MKVSIFDMLWKTPTTLWDKLGETPSSYFMSLVSLYKNPYLKNQEIDIFLCAHCLDKNILEKFS